ncbi:hypothetical protein B0I35DRAFT_411006 [Stachybotrys elegans]|uniref:Uncharacterized protein n=1 Tax=Stachybotrys elegans TaxID=80388 RepID=A0A8K0SH74_9HYPO|nr:hypothetical protein B0I35DRAFT_411006 [Stachybotrys elegans]
MARFTFPVPGRKKQPPPQPLVPETMTKAHKILGTAAPLNIDSPRSWDDVSGISVDVSESTPPTSYDDDDDDARWHDKAKAPARDEWADESAIVPPRFKIDYTGDALDFSESSTALRNKPSSSTIKSWYDKSKMPLAISQQTSASAMAKGMPSKAHKMLDMDNAHTKIKAKRPPRLDFSSLVPSSTRHLLRSSQNHATDDFLLSPEYITKSPSALSSVSPASGRRLRKKSTKETLRTSSAEPTPSTTASSGSRRAKDGRFDELPDLYEHYEQMSFRQIMHESAEEEQHDVAPPAAPVPAAPIPAPERKIEEDRKSAHSKVSEKSDLILLQPRRYRDSKSLQHLAPPAAAPGLNIGYSPASDCAASISSGHTRTSKASAAGRSFQDSDLQETSVLMLSSDSEDDEYLDPPAKTPQSSRDRRGSGISESAHSLGQHSFASSRPSGNSEKRSSRSGKRTSFATSNTYLTIPNRRDSQLAFYESGTTTGSVMGLQLQQYSSAASVHSASSAHSAPAWQSRSDYGIREVPMESPEEGLDDEDLDGTCDSSSRHDSSAAGQPTPPLSPSSVDFYIRSARSSIDGPGSHNRFMAVTHQEQMLLAALRNKRQEMRDTRAEFRAYDAKHYSSASEATVTDAQMSFDFPLPPSFNDSAAKSVGMRSITPHRVLSIQANSPPQHTLGQDDEDGVVSPYPKYPSTWKAVFYKDFDLDTDDQAVQANGNEESPPGNKRISRAPSTKVQDPLRSQRQVRRVSSRSSIASNGAANNLEELSSSRSGYRHRTLAELESFMPMVAEDDYDTAEAGVPRPDSPISPSCFPAPPTMTSLHKKMARLSAVGPAPQAQAEW